MNKPPENQIDDFWYQLGEKTNPKFLARFGGMPPLAGATMLDFGCERGRLVIDMALAGAIRVVGVDMDPQSMAFARRNLTEAHPELADRVAFHEGALDILPEFANFYCAMAYPGSKLYDHAVKQKLPLPPSWSGYSQFAADTLPLPTKHLSGAEVLRFRDQAYREYNTNKRYLGTIAEKYGRTTVDDILRTASRTLHRNFA